jgi:hypothetical protein
MRDSLKRRFLPFGNFFASNRWLRHPEASVEKYEILKNALDGMSSLRQFVWLFKTGC